MNIRRKPDLRRGAVAVEFAILLPLMFLFLMGIWEVGRMINIRQTLMCAAREAGRQAAIGMPENELPDVVLNCLSRAGLETDNVQVGIDADATLPDGDETYALTVSIPFEDVRWLVASLFTSPSDLITVQSVWPRS